MKTLILLILFVALKVSAQSVPFSYWLSQVPPNYNVANLTNLTSSYQARVSNVVLVAATSMTISIKTDMPSTNYVPAISTGGLAIPGLAFTGITTTNFTMSMTALTFTGNMYWTATMMTQ